MVEIYKNSDQQFAKRILKCQIFRNKLKILQTNEIL